MIEVTKAYKCRECGVIVDFDSYPPEMRETYLRLKSMGLCERCYHEELNEDEE